MWRQSLEESTTGVLKALLESKHLYQSGSIDDNYLIGEFKKRVMPEDEAYFTMAAHKAAFANWTAVDKSAREAQPLGHVPDTKREMRFTVPDVKLYCSVCNRTEAFNSISAEDFLGRAKQDATFGLYGKLIQIFVLSFLCQSCKSVPEVFVVRREGTKFKLCGRAPIEHVDVPKVIPKVVGKFYSGAVVAHQSGQTLAGLFLLRTLIEQWTRDQLPNEKGKADQVLDAYMAKLPEDFKGRFPSLRELYENLSKDIHAATGSSELFADSIKKIDRHFEARRLFGFE